jgi:pimeloyl-ACP methyl ester carboxylesterase
MRTRLIAATAGALVTAAWLAPRPVETMGKPGVTPVPCGDLAWTAADPAFDALPGAKAFSGKYDGGIYRVEIPDNWNGDLVLYAHGYRAATGRGGTELRVGNAPIREHLIGRGYAWATSSYRCNGYVPGQGLEDTVALVDLFTKFNGGRAPNRTYLTGHSMGGHVTLLGMQEYPTRFAAGLAMCPAGPGLFDYYAAVGGAAEVITGVTFTLDGMREETAKMGEILGSPPAYTAKGRQLASVEIQISGGTRPFAMEGLQSRFLGNISGAALAGSQAPSSRAVDTTAVKYAIGDGLGISAADLNARARRAKGDPAIRSANGPYEELAPFDGQIARPLLTMHGTGDLFVPIFLERTLEDAVHRAGHDDLLVQRIYRIAGHCQFSDAEMTRSFDDLVTWVTAGTRPSGDDVTADLRDAGRQFTNPIREGDPGVERVE